MILGTRRLGPLAGFFTFLLSASCLAGPAQPITQLESHSDAMHLAEEILKVVRAAGDPKEATISFVHLQGPRVNPYLAATIITLANAGVTVQGTLISADDFEAEKAKFLEQADHDPSLKEFLVQYQPERGEKMSLVRRLDEFKKTYFGVPGGITYWQHFLKEKPTIKFWDWQRRLSTRRSDFANDEAGEKAWLQAKAEERGVRQRTIPTVGLGAFWLSVSLGAMGMSPAEMVLPVGVLASWIGLFTYYYREVALFKAQGRDVRLLPNEPAGRQMTLVRNKRFYIFSSLIQSFMINALNIASIFSPAQLTPERLTNAAWNSLFGVFAKAPVEFWNARISVAATEARERGDLVEQRKLSRLAHFSGLAWDQFYGFAKNFHLMAGSGKKDESGHSVLPWYLQIPKYLFAGIGTAGIVMDLYPNRKAILEGFGAFIQQAVSGKGDMTEGCESLVKITLPDSSAGSQE
jgi:hypothetical protein